MRTRSPVSQRPGNVFAFKIIEYLAAGAHVITTPMGTLEPEIEKGITYMPRNDSAMIAATLNRVIGSGDWERGAQGSVSKIYGSAAIAESMEALLRKAGRRAEAEPALERVLE